MSVRLRKPLTPLLLQLEQKLRQCGPAGLMMLGTVHNSIHRHLPYDFVVDSLSDFQAGMARSPLPPESKRIDEVVTIYAQNPGALRNLLAKQDIVNWDRRTVFKPVPPSCIPVLKEAASRNGTWKHAFDNSYHVDPHFVLHASNPLEPVPRFSGEHQLRDYHLGSLDPSHAAQLVTEWGYAEQGTLEYFESQLQYGVSVAAYETIQRESIRDGDSGEATQHPVAYALQSDDTSLIHLHVSPEHRKKHLGLLIMSELIRKMHALNMHMAAFGYIWPENTVSQRICTSCGMVRRPGEWYWLEFVPRDHSCRSSNI